MAEETLLDVAWAIASAAHDGQVDKAGKPYFTHPIRVAASLEGDDAKIVGLLHDTVEDTPVTLDDLRARGFGAHIIDAIDAISRRDSEPKEDYYQRVMDNRLALEVKIADMMDNMDPSRIPNPTAQDRRRTARYEQVLPRLRAALQASE